jgi:hypothetical protein
VFQAPLGDERVLKSFQRYVKKQLGQDAGGACCICFATDASADNRQLQHSCVLGMLCQDGESACLRSVQGGILLLQKW